MAGIEGIGGNGGISPGTVKPDTLGKDDFLKMLVAQLKNQDPLNPLDGADFTAQLAQFSSLEQLSNMNAQLEFANLYQASLNNAQSVSLIGKEVTATGDMVRAEGASADLNYILPEDARDITIKIYDADGNLVDILEPGSREEGENSVTWDCSGVAAGNYSFEVSATNGNGDEIPVYTIMTGRVTGVTFKDGSPYLSVNGRDIAFGDVICVSEPAD